VRAWLLTLVAVVIIATAVLVGVGRALIPYADSLRPWLTEQLSVRLGEPVQIGRIEAQWPRLTPQLSLYDLRVGPGAEPLLLVDQARLEVHLPNLVSRERNLMELVILGLDLVLEQDNDGQWGLRVEGGGQLGDRQRSGDPGLFGDLVIRDAELTVKTVAGWQFGGRLIEGDVQRRGQETSVRGRLQPVGFDSSTLEFSLLLEAENQRWSRGRAWLGGEELRIRQWLDIPGVPENATLALQAWTNWDEATEGRIDMDLSLAGLNDLDATLDAELLISRAQRTTQVEIISLSKTESQVGGQSNRQKNEPNKSLIKGLAVARRSDQSWALALDEMQIEPVHALISPWFAERSWWPSSASGRLVSIMAGWRMDAGLHRLSGNLVDLEWRLPDRFPSLANLSLTLGLSGDRPVLMPSGQPQVEWASMFKEPIIIKSTSGRALLSSRAVELQGLEIDTGLVRGTTDGWLYFAQRKPFVDLFIDVAKVGPLDPRRFLPQRFIPPKADQWLNRSLTWVESASGHVLLSMQAGLKADQIRRGHIEAEVALAGVDIDYFPQWPAASDISGDARFIGRELTASISSANLGELALSSAELSLADLRQPELDLTLNSGPRDAASVTELLRQIPIEVWQRSLMPMRWSGGVDITTSMRFPIKRMEDWWLEGEARLDNASLALPTAGLNFKKLRGPVGFDRQALGPATLELGTDQPQEEPTELDLLASFAQPAWLEIDGRVDPQDLLIDSDRLTGQLEGQAAVGTRISAHPDGGLAVDLSSDLDGLSSTLPAPLNKTSDTAWPLRLAVHLDDGLQSGNVSVADILDLHAERDGTDWRVGVLIGQPSRAQAMAVPESGLRLRGSLPYLNLDDWQELLWSDWAIDFSSVAGNVDGEANDDIQADLDLSVGQLELAGVRVNDVTLELGRNDNAWRARFDGPDAVGELTIPIPLDSGRVVVADFQRLRFDPIQNTDHDDAEQSGELAERAVASQISSENPIGRPPLHVLIEDLHWGELDLGRARVETHSSARGTEIEMIDVSGPDLRFNGTGRWLWHAGLPESQLAGRLTTSSVDDLLESAGYQSPLQAERSQLEVDLRWPGAPTDFQLARLSGTLDLQIADGTIPEARPGAGRLLGLGSLAALPRRLTLDFRDVFDAGLAFDQIEGRFDLTAGFARTEALTVYSPAALITISGDTDMATRQYDQIVRVEPGLGGTLPVIGVLAGGPVGAAAGLVLQSILERPMRGLAEARYTVTGPWNEPKMELVGARAGDTDQAVDQPINENERPPD